MGVLRFLLALSVLIEHSKPIFGISLVPGELAVESFFMVSGFYMALVIKEKYSKIPNYYKLFITNRFLRIFPLYWLVVLISIIAFTIDGYSSGDFHTLHLYYEYFNSQTVATKAYLIVSNVIIFGQEYAYFFGIDQNGALHATSNSLLFHTPFYHFFIVAVVWSISLELVFYLVSPLVIKFKKPHLLIVISFLLLLRLGLKLANIPYDPFIYRLLPTQLVFFLLGTFAYHFYNFIESKSIPVGLNAGMSALVILLIIGYGLFPRSNLLDFIYLTIIFITMPFVFKYSKAWKLDRFIGELSYPMYLTHLLVFAFTGKVLTALHRGDRWFSLVGALITIALSFLMVRFVSYYIEKYRANRVSKSSNISCRRWCFVSCIL